MSLFTSTQAHSSSSDDEGAHQWDPSSAGESADAAATTVTQSTGRRESVSAAVSEEVRAMAKATATASWRSEFPTGWPEYLCSEEIRSRLRKRGVTFDAEEKHDKCSLLREMYRMLDQLELEKKCFCYLHIIAHRAERLPNKALFGTQCPYVEVVLWPGGETHKTNWVRAGPTAVWERPRSVPRSGDSARGTRGAQRRAEACRATPPLAAAPASARAATGATTAPFVAAPAEAQWSAAGLPPNHLVWKLPFRPARSEHHWCELKVLKEGTWAPTLLGRSGRVKLHKLIKDRGAAGTDAAGAGVPPVWVRLQDGAKLQVTAYYHFVRRAAEDDKELEKTKRLATPRRSGGSSRPQAGWQPPPSSVRVAYWAMLSLCMLTFSALAWIVHARPELMRTVLDLVGAGRTAASTPARTGPGTAFGGASHGSQAGSQDKGSPSSALRDEF
eukprot:g3787.t1